MVVVFRNTSDARDSCGARAYFLAFFDGGGGATPDLLVLLAVAAAALVLTLGFAAVFTDLETSFLPGVTTFLAVEEDFFLTGAAAAFFTGDAAALLLAGAAAALNSSSAFFVVLVATAGAFLRGGGGFTAAFDNLGALGGALGALAADLVFFKRVAGGGFFAATFVGFKGALISLTLDLSIAATTTGLLGALDSTSFCSLKEFLILYTFPCFVMLRSWLDKIFLKLGGKPALYTCSRYLAIAYWLDPVRSFKLPIASFTICQEGSKQIQMENPTPPQAQTNKKHSSTAAKSYKFNKQPSKGSSHRERERSAK